MNWGHALDLLHTPTGITRPAALTTSAGSYMAREPGLPVTC